MPPSELTAGPRQTIDRVRHPRRGEGIAVHDNGVAFFQPDGGAPVAMAVGYGGANRERSWRTLHDPQYGRVEADLIENGERHHRTWNPLLGLGWLVWETSLEWLRFETDDGRVTRFQWARLAVGTPEYAKAAARKSRYREMTAEEARWRTFEMSDGTVLAFRAGGPPEPAAPAPSSSKGEQLALEGAT